MINDNILLLVLVPSIAFISPYFAKFLKIPTISMEIILGIVAGGFFAFGHNDMFDIFAEIGFLFLMFLAGLEVQFLAISNIDKKFIKPIFIYIASVHILSFLFIFFMDMPYILGVIIPLISVGVIATLSKEYGGDTHWIKMAFIIGTIAEIVSIVEFSIASNAFISGFNIDLLLHFIYLILFLIGFYLLFRLISVLMWWYPDIAKKLTPSIDTQEKDIRLSMFILLNIIVVMYLLDFELALGAFVAGMLIRAFFVTQEDLIHKLEGFGFGFFVPVFFIHIGITFDATSLSNLFIIKTAFLISFVMVIARVFSSLIFKKFLLFKDLILISLSHSMPLSLLIAIATIAYKSHHLSSEYYNILVLASLIEVLFVTSLIKVIVIKIKNDTKEQL